MKKILFEKNTALNSPENIAVYAQSNKCVVYFYQGINKIYWLQNSNNLAR